LIGASSFNDLQISRETIDPCLTLDPLLTLPMVDSLLIRPVVVWDLTLPDVDSLLALDSLLTRESLLTLVCAIDLALVRGCDILDIQLCCWRSSSTTDIGL